MLLFFCFLVTVINFNVVKAYIPIAMGEDSFVLPNEIACTRVWQSNPPVPSTHPGYELTNIGNVTIRASIYWKDSWPLQTDDVFCEAHLDCSTNSSINVWYELADPVHIEPSASAVIRPSAKATFYFTRLVVISNNSSHLKAVVQVKYETDGIKRKREITANSNASACDTVKTVFKFGGSKLPVAVAASGAEALIELFWPENKTSVWDEIRDKVKNLIDQETFYIVKALTGRLMGFKRKLELVAGEVKAQSDASIHYMHLAQDFIGLEEESIVRGHHNAKKLNEDLLPIYSNIVLMKAAFYSLGIKCQERISLNEKNVANLKTYFSDMIRSPTHGANQYVSLIFRNQCTGNYTYSKEMFMRNKINEHGYIPIWNNMLDHPGEKLVVDEVVYSDLWGGYYASDNVLPPSIEPLTSYKSSDGKYNEVQKFIVYENANASCVNDSSGSLIVGMKLIFKNGNTSEFGKITHVYRAIELNGAYRIHSIEGRWVKQQCLANLHISLLKLDKGNERESSTTEEYIFGCSDNASVPYKYLLAKENYYIASIFAVFDPHNSVHPLLSVAVSYLPSKSNLDNTVDEKWKEWTCC